MLSLHPSLSVIVNHFAPKIRTDETGRSDLLGKRTPPRYGAKTYIKYMDGVISLYDLAALHDVAPRSVVRRYYTLTEQRIPFTWEDLLDFERQVKLTEYDGEMLTDQEIADRLEISRNTYVNRRWRLAKGMTTEDPHQVGRIIPQRSGGATKPREEIGNEEWFSLSDEDRSHRLKDIG